MAHTAAHTLHLLQGYHVSLSKEHYCAFESICILMNPRLPLIWCLLDLVLDVQQKKNDQLGFVSTDKISKSPEDWTMPSFFYKVTVAVQAKLGYWKRHLYVESVLTWPELVENIAQTLCISHINVYDCSEF